MYLKIELEKGGFRILEQSCVGFNKYATNGVHILTCSSPEIRAHSREFFLRGMSRSLDLKFLGYPYDGSFTNYLRALEEVVDSFVVCLR